MFLSSAKKRWSQEMSFEFFHVTGSLTYKIEGSFSKNSCMSLKHKPRIFMSLKHKLFVFLLNHVAQTQMICIFTSTSRKRSVFSRR